jgi:hypothetical protein
MLKLSCFIALALLLLAGLGAAGAGEKGLVPGDPPLTQSMVDDYCRYVAWRSPQALVRAGGPQRFGQLLVNDWKNGDKARQSVVLADLKWWREEFPKLDQAAREQPVARELVIGRYANPASPAPGEEDRLLAREQEAIKIAQLQQWNDARQLQIRALSNLQASHHETMMLIIDNVRPSGRYRPNP